MKSYSITNMKAFKERAHVELKPITIFVGKNSCGKSSLLRFPAVLSQTFGASTTSPLKFYGKLIDYGNYEDVVFNHSDESISFSICYDFDLVSDVYSIYLGYGDSNTPPHIHNVEISVSLIKSKKKVVIEKNEIYIDNTLCYGLYRNSSDNYTIKVFFTYNRENDSFLEDNYEISIKPAGSEQFFIKVDEHELNSSILNTYFPDGFPELEKAVEGKNGVRYFDLISMPSTLRKMYLSQNNIDFPNSDRIKKLDYIVTAFHYYERLLAMICSMCSYEMEYLSYIGPFRINPERVYRDEEFQTKTVGVKGENVSTVLIRDFQKKQELVGRISSWLNKTMGYNLVVDDMNNGLFRILLEDRNGIKSNLMDVGYGISQILPIIAQILVDSPVRNPYTGDIDDLIVVEQPELHLHPAAQSELAELFVNGAIVGKKKMLIETHSEHFIRKLQVLVADPNNKITNNDIAIYYVDKSNDGSAFIRNLDMLPNGKFAKKWPSGFFDKAHELSMELLNLSSI